MANLMAAVPAILTSPQNQTVASGGTVSFSVTASGDAPLTYEWWGEFGPLVPARTNATLVLSSVELGDSGIYKAVVRNAAGAAVSGEATLTVNPPTGAGGGGSFFWARKTTGPGADPGANLAVDPSGNCYLIGSFTGSVRVGGTTLNATEGSDVFIAKFNRAGSLVWVRKAGGAGDDYGAGVAVDDFGNVHVTGSFTGNAEFGGVPLSSAGGLDVFVACYDRSGRPLWAQRAGGNGTDRASRIAVDAVGNSFVVGTFSGTAGFGSGTWTSAGDADVFLAKFGSDGQPLWAKRFGGNLADAGTSVSVGPAGTVFIAGHFRGPADFGSVTLSDGGKSELFIAKADHTGTILWVRRTGGADASAGAGVAVGEDGNSYLSGAFSAVASFGSVTLTNRGANDHFIASYDAEGRFAWVARVGALEGSESALGLPSGDNRSVTTFATGGVDYSGGLGGNVDLAVGRFAGPNSLVWGKESGSNLASFSLGQFMDDTGNQYLVGYFEEPQGGSAVPGYSVGLIKSARSSPRPPPLITTQPQAAAVAMGGSATFSVGAQGNGALGYQWYFNGVAIGDSHGASYSIQNAQPAHSGVYRVVVFNWDGSVTSTEATLVVQGPGSPPTHPLAPARGIYSGLFFATESVQHHSSGYFTLTSTERGSFTASMRTGGRVLPLSGRFDSEGRATNLVARAGTNALEVELQLSLGDEEVLTGRITDGHWTALLSSPKMTLHPLTNRAAFAGKYTLRIPGQPEAREGPDGDGFATVTVGPGGLVSWVATLADGSPAVTQRSPVSKEGMWPLYVPLYHGKGSMLSWMRFADGTNTDLSGALSWIKPVLPAARFYPGGFTNETPALGSAYVRPAHPLEAAPGGSNAVVTLSGGNLNPGFVLPLWPALTSRNNSGGGVTIRFSLNSGLFSGSAVNPGSGKRVPFKGVLLQKAHAACGLHSGTNQTGRVLLGPP